MKKFLILLVLFAVGCGGGKKAMEESKEEVDVHALVDEINSSGKITDKQAESLSKVEDLYISAACQPLIAKYRKQ